MARPSPEPRDPAPLTNRSKTWGSSAGSMPGPVSRTVSQTTLAVADPPSETVPPPGRISQGIGHEIGEHLADPHRVEIQDRQVALVSIIRVTPAAAAAGVNARTTSPIEEVRVGRLGMQGQRAALGQGDRPQILDQPLHDPRLLEDRAKVRGIRRIDAVEDRL